MSNRDANDTQSIETNLLTISSTASNIKLPDQNDEEPLILSHDTNPGIPIGTPPESQKTLGMFFGVIVPCTLSMFSIVLFLRVGYLVGFAGTIGGVSIIITSYFIIAMTVLSLCALCTNGKIEAGGAYYMISRTLGPEFGSSIGLMFFIANVASCALYIFGFIEILMASFSVKSGAKAKILPDSYWFNFLYASGILCICTGICMIGSSAYSKSVVFIFALIVSCLVMIFVSFFVTEPFEVVTPGGNDNTTHNYTSFSWENWDSNHNFIWSDEKNIDYISGHSVDLLQVFAVFFNGCIGVMAGVNVSGELIKPNKAIPKGTIIACGFTSVVYIILVLLIASTCSHELLINDYTILQKINICPILIFIGVGCASVSAVLSNMIGASRVLFAIANDRIFGKNTAVTNFLTNKSIDGNPYGSVFFTFFLVLCFFLLGNLNAVAPIVTTFFLMAYAAVDGACLALTVTSAPNFRPTFRYFNSMTCSIGLIGTLFMMVLVSPLYAFFSCCIFGILFISVHLVSNATRSENNDAWGHISQAIIYHQVRKYLLMLDSRKDHIKYWRPQILILHKKWQDKESQICLTFANDLKKSGLLVVGYVMSRNESERNSNFEICDRAYQKAKSVIDGLKIKAFLEVTRADSVLDGCEQLLRLSGLGGMKPNILMLGFYEKIMTKSSSTPISSSTTERLTDLKITTPEDYQKIIVATLKLNKNICIYRDMSSLHRSNRGFVDVYPFMFILDKEKSNYYNNFSDGDFTDWLDNSSLFILQMACILSMSENFKSKGIIGSGVLEVI